MQLKAQEQLWRRKNYKKGGVLFQISYTVYTVKLDTSHLKAESVSSLEKKVNAWQLHEHTNVSCEKL